MRRKFIVDFKFQWTIIGYSFTVSLLTSLTHFTAGKLAILQRLRAQDGMITGWLASDSVIVVIFILLYSALFLASLLLSNRLAGPLYRLRKYMQNVSEGKKAEPIFFRKGDYFEELNTSYNKLVEKINNPKGFTLIEMMVVVAILSILTVMALSSYLIRPQNQAVFATDVANLQYILSSARNIAVVQNECAIATIASANTVSIDTYAIPSPCTPPLPIRDAHMVQTLSSGAQLTSFSSGSNTLTFKPSGGTTAPGPVTLVLNNPALQMTSTFTIYPAIGQVRHQ